MFLNWFLSYSRLSSISFVRIWISSHLFTANSQHLGSWGLIHKEGL